ncbi:MULTISPECIES: RidA family protein [Chelativorans]|uniref:RidA family protein n=1 Tax=Chelativorans TaxID=449972 RepID=UPI0002DC94F8|nr:MULTISPECIES: RidA family protein [Chelativorans]
MPEFTDHPAVIDGASELIVAARGDAGKHARSAVGCALLPREVAVEVDAIFELV